VSSAPDPSEIFDRAVEEGNRRLDQSLVELVSTSFIAGFTIVFGLAAFGIAHAMVEPELGRISDIAGGLAFGLGLVFLVVGRTELFNENFFDPVAAAVENDGWMVGPLLRLWAITFVFNFVGGVPFAALMTVEGALPPGAPEALVKTAEELARRSVVAGFASAVVGGALVTLLSFLLEAVDSTGSRIAVSYMVGFVLAFGAFDHVVVTVLHVFFGIVFGSSVGYGELFVTMAVATAGNLVGGLGLVTVSHVAQVMGARNDSN